MPRSAPTACPSTGVKLSNIGREKRPGVCPFNPCHWRTDSHPISRVFIFTGFGSEKRRGLQCLVQQIIRGEPRQHDHPDRRRG